MKKKFLFCLQDGCDVQKAATEKDGRYTQPYLLAVGPEKEPSQFFLVLDRIAVPAGLHLVQALDSLFKAHYVFNVEYSLTLQPFWEFFAAVVYNIIKPAQAKPAVLYLLTALNSVSVQ